MTPKEKAIELVKKMYGNIFDGGQYEDAEESWYNAKQCALIAVDEILSSNPNYPEFKENEGTPIRYWEVVKQEIEAL